METMTLYVGAHLALLIAVVASGLFRIRNGSGGLVAWGNDSLYIGLVFIVALTGALLLTRG